MKKDNDDFLRLARDRFKTADDAENENRELALEDIRFRDGDQWTDKAKKTRKDRPCLTVNRMEGFVDDVVGEMRQNSPSIKVKPIDDKGDKITAKILEGIIRNIEYQSNSDQAYVTAFDHSAGHGFGYFRVVTDYAGDDSFDQEIKIKRIKNSFTVYFDPNCQEADFSDAKFCFVTELVTKEEFKENWPDKEPVDWDDARNGDNRDKWYEEDKVRIAEYYVIEDGKKYELWLLEQVAEIIIDTREGPQPLMLDGETLRSDEIPNEVQEYIEAGIITVKKTRKVIEKKVMHYKICGHDVLEKSEFPSKWIPVIPVLGKELNIEGETRLRGVIRHAKDSQRIYNYMRSTIAEVLGLQPKVPFMMEERQIDGYVEDWKASSSENRPFLLYKSVDTDGRDINAAAPHRPDAQQPSVALFQEAGMSIDDMKAATGVYDASVGAQGNETSGKAILARQRESSTSNFAYTDNLKRALTHCGRILVDMIPSLYDTKRTVRILGIDDEPMMIRLYEENNLPGFGDKGEDVEGYVPDLSVGKYDVAVTMGASYATRRLEAADMITEFVRSNPAIGPFVLDIVAEAQDWPGADKIAERVRQLQQMQGINVDGGGQPAVNPQGIPQGAGMPGMNQPPI